MKPKLAPFLANYFGLLVAWSVWLWLALQPLSLGLSLALAFGAALAIIPLVFLARRLLDRQADASHAGKVTLVFHYLIAALFGTAVLAGLTVGQKSQHWPLPIPPWLGLALMALALAVLLAAVAALLLAGLGVPHPLARVRALVAGGVSAWLSDPLTLSVLALLVGLGLWLRSAIFVLWVLVVVSPLALAAMRIFERHEVEQRFGPRSFVS